MMCLIIKADGGALIDSVLLGYPLNVQEVVKARIGESLLAQIQEGVVDKS